MLLNNLKETKLKIYKSVFVAAVVSSKLFKHRGKVVGVGGGTSIQHMHSWLMVTLNSDLCPLYLL